MKKKIKNLEKIQQLSDEALEKIRQREIERERDIKRRIFLDSLFELFEDAQDEEI